MNIQYMQIFVEILERLERFGEFFMWAIARPLRNSPSNMHCQGFVGVHIL